MLIQNEEKDFLPFHLYHYINETVLCTIKFDIYYFFCSTINSTVTYMNLSLASSFT